MDERWRAKAPGYNRRRLYGIDPEQYAALLAAQDHRCAICHTETPGGKGSWHVDHDHTTKAIRGLLCHACNIGLGNFDEDPARLLAAAAYLGG